MWTGAAVGIALVFVILKVVLLESYQLVRSPFYSSPRSDGSIGKCPNPKGTSAAFNRSSKQNQTRRPSRLHQAQKSKGIPRTTSDQGAVLITEWSILFLGAAKDGVELNSIVMSPGGLLGRLAKFGQCSSVVTLLSDAFNQVGVTVSRTRATGLLKWGGDKAGSQSDYGILR
jgi:rod shape-determining protein MreC